MSQDIPESDDKILSGRIASFVQVTEGDDPCWVWTGYVDSAGYPRVSWQQRSVRAHMEALRLAGRHLRQGEVWQRRCATEHCIRPEHWEPITRSDKARRSPLIDAHLRATHCPSGHRYDEANTYLNARGWRSCRTCHREQERRSRATA